MNTNHHSRFQDYQKYLLLEKVKAELTCQCINWKIYQLLPLPDIRELSTAESEQAVEVLCQLQWLKESFSQILRKLDAYLEVQHLYIPLGKTQVLTPSKLVRMLDELHELYKEIDTSFQQFMQKINAPQAA